MDKFLDLAAAYCAANDLPYQLIHRPSGDRVGDSFDWLFRIRLRDAYGTWNVDIPIRAIRIKNVEDIAPATAEVQRRIRIATQRSRMDRRRAILNRLQSVA